MNSSRRTILKAAAGMGLAASASAASPQRNTTPVALQGAVEALDFSSREVYRSAQRPGYTSWVSFFPGERGQWYLTCEEVLRRDPPNPRMSREMMYAFGMPNGYDKAPYEMQLVILESRDGLKTWDVISREPVRFQHSAGSFGQARTANGRFLRFVWQSYSLDEDMDHSRIFYTSDDNGKTWDLQPPFHDARLLSYSHRLRTLRDGTLVLALPFMAPWGPGTDLPRRTCMDLNKVTSMQMTLCFSHDHGATWSTPLPVLPGQSLVETDFVELPSGDLMIINSSMSSTPGRQRILRTKQGFVASFMERCDSPVVPETVCLVGDDLLVGCMRNSKYFWSDDLGLNWYPLEGIPKEISQGRETYQPWIQHLGDGVVVNAGHYGGDNFVGEVDQYLMLHQFRLQVKQTTTWTKLELARDFDATASRWLNRYTLKLSADEKPLAGEKIEVWFVERDKPGYDSWQKYTLAERLAMGGETVRAQTDNQGVAKISLPQFDKIESIHHTIQMIARFNTSRSETAYKPAQTPLFEFYSNVTY